MKSSPYSPTPSNILFCDCEVLYSGRAESTLIRGNYLIIIKNDRSVQIHGASLVKPLNYQGPATIERTDTQLLVRCRKETLTITIHKVIQEHHLPGWSDNRIQVTNTEQHLVDLLVTNISRFFTGVKKITREASTPHGSVDLLIEADRLYVIEVKRKVATIAAGGQLLRYLACRDAYSESDQQEVIGCIVAPSISPNCAKLLASNNCLYIKLGFDLQTDPTADIGTNPM